MPISNDLSTSNAANLDSLSENLRPFAYKVRVCPGDIRRDAGYISDITSCAHYFRLFALRAILV